MCHVFDEVLDARISGADDKADCSVFSTLDALGEWHNQFLNGRRSQGRSGQVENQTPSISLGTAGSRKTHPRCGHPLSVVWGVVILNPGSQPSQPASGPGGRAFPTVSTCDRKP